MDDLYLVPDVPHEYLLSLTVYRDGTLRLHAPKMKPGSLGYVLRQIADAADAGAIDFLAHEYEGPLDS